MKAWLIALSAALASSPVLADSSLRLSGSLAAVTVQADDTLEDSKVVLGASGRLSLEAQPSQALSLKLQAEHASDKNLGVISNSTWLREATARYSQDTFDLTVGRQLLVAGKTDLIPLQDQFMPRDLSQQGMNDTEQRLALPALRLDAYAGDAWTFTGALVVQDRSYILPSRVRNAVPDWKTLQDEPAHGALARLGYRQGIWEWEAGASLGASPLPALSVTPSGLETHFPREHRLFVDGTLTLSRGVLRWDMVRTVTQSKDYPGLPSGHWAFTLGWDQGLWSDASFTGQWIYRRDQMPDASLPILAPVAAANQALAQAFAPAQQWLTATLKQRVGNEHELEASLLAGSAHQRGAIARWSWRMSDGWTLGMRLQVLHGEGPSLLASLTPARQFYLELRHYFDWM